MDSSVYTFELVALQSTLSGLKILKAGQPLRFDEDKDIIIVGVVSQTPIRRIHDPRHGHHEEAMWFLAGGRMYLIRDKSVPRRDLHVVSSPFPLRQDLPVRKLPAKGGYTILSDDKADVVKRLLKDLGC
ncbi:hypothetical protein APHAL10511_002800 [Amanita phalloides]|nr:hypothetical protein APHAL10511_002800 [Amanita phalloides]